MPVFVDTNVVVYAFGRDEAKAAISEAILADQPTVSVQVISEFLNVCRVKLGLEIQVRHRLAQELLAGCNVVAIDARVVAKAMEIEREARIAYWDTLIVAALAARSGLARYVYRNSRLRVVLSRVRRAGPSRLPNRMSPPGA